MMDRGNFVCRWMYCNCKEIIFDVVCENLVGNGGMCWCGYVPTPQCRVTNVILMVLV